MRARLVGTAVASVAVILTASVALAQSPSGQPESDVTPTGPVTTVVGTEYAFSGLPESVPAGTTFGFTNEGRSFTSSSSSRRTTASPRRGTS
jgi:hypothetical protein